MNAITFNTRPTYLNEIIETLTSRTKAMLGKDGKPGLNLNEFIFLRRAAVAWDKCC
ncbi:MAG: hypothetical protein ACK52J_00620 [bacterium]|jgi:hypothetical protein